MSTETTEEFYAKVRRFHAGSPVWSGGAELLIRTGWAHPGRRWMCPDGGVLLRMLDDDNIAAYSSGQRAVLALGRSLLGGDPVRLDDCLRSADFQLQAEMLAAIAIACGRDDVADLASENVPTPEEFMAALMRRKTQ